jgi:hypothetical protein
MYIPMASLLMYRVRETGPILLVPHIQSTALTPQAICASSMERGNQYYINSTAHAKVILSSLLAHDL